MIDLVLDALIPADADLGMPSASTIDFPSYARKHQIEELTALFLADVGAVSASKFQREFADLDADERLNAINACKTRNVRVFANFLNHCFKAYYTNRRVLEIISSSSSPPFPDGNILPQDDWELLEPVYNRGIIYRPINDPI